MNYRHKQQKKELQFILNNDKLLNLLNTEAKYKYVKNYQDYINSNFKYNKKTKDLIIRLWRNVYCCHKFYKLPCSFAVKAGQMLDGFTTKEKRTTIARLQRLLKDNIIGKISFKNNGSFYYFKVDITESCKS